jgi:hypothetical protein
MIFGKNIRQKQGFFDMNIGKTLFCVKLKPKSCPKGAKHLLRECGSFCAIIASKVLETIETSCGLFPATRPK